MSTLPSGPTLFFSTTAGRLALSAEILSEGQIAYDQEANSHYFWDGASWQPFAGGGGGDTLDVTFGGNLA